MATKSIKELAAEAGRAIKASTDDAGARRAARDKQATPAAPPAKNRPDAFSAIFDKALATLREAQGAMKDVLASEAIALHDARPQLSDAGSPRDRSLIKGGRALDGLVCLIIPVGKADWRASFGRECVNYATVVRNTDKRHPIKPMYGDTVIAYLHTGAEDAEPLIFVEIDPHDVGDVGTWVEARVGAMMEAIVRQRSPHRARGGPSTMTETPKPPPAAAGVELSVGMVARMDDAPSPAAEVGAAAGAVGEGEPGVPGGAGAEEAPSPET